jgi:hypothetical protein
MVGVAVASGDDSMYFPASYVKAGPIIGEDIGYLHHSIYPGQDDITNIDSRVDYFGSITVNAYVGYNFQFNNYLLLGAEIGGGFLSSTSYSDSHNPEYNNEELAQYALDILFTSHLYVYKGWNFFGKLGAAMLYQVSKNIIYKDNQEIAMFRIRPEYAIGLGYTFSKQIDLHFMYQHIGSESDADSIAASDALLLGVSYTF